MPADESDYKTPELHPNIMTNLLWIFLILAASGAALGAVWRGSRGALVAIAVFLGLATGAFVGDWSWSYLKSTFDSFDAFLFSTITLTWFVFLFTTPILLPTILLRELLDGRRERK